MLEKPCVALPPCTTGRALVRGCANAGKTTAALARVEALLAAGADPCSVLFVAASHTAAADARRALAGSCGSAAADVRVTCAPDFELGLLDAPAARALTGRRPRVLAEFEYAFLMDDLRAESIPTKNLKGMLGFFQRSWTELADDLDGFVVDPREAMCLDALACHLGAYDAMLASEVAKLAVHYLRACSNPAEAFPVAHVVIDDYTSLSRASQIVFEMLEPETLWVFADPHAAPRGADPFPYLKGVDEFVQRNPQAAVVDLPDPSGCDVRAAAGWLAKSGYVDALTPGLLESRGAVEVQETYEVAVAPEPFAGVAHAVHATPQEELAAVARQAFELVDGGAAMSQVLVAVPNRTWAKGVRKELAALGVPAQALGARQAVGGDVHRLDACGSARMYAALGLLADPTDPLAWRSWCGFGDAAGRSSVFQPLARSARKTGLSLPRALEEALAGRLEGVSAHGVRGAWEQGRAMLEALSGLRGRTLLAELARGLGLDGVPDVFARACKAAGEEALPAQLFSAVRRLVFAPELAGEEAGVRIAELSRVTGIKARHVLVAGFMNGWLPRHAYFDNAEAIYAERQRIDREGRHATYNIVGCATHDLRFSGFTSCDLEVAERLKLKGYRVSMGPDMRRVTTCRPSVFLDYALDAWNVR